MVTIENIDKYLSADTISKLQQYCFDKKIPFDIQFLRRVSLCWHREGNSQELILDKDLPTQNIIWSNHWRQNSFVQTLEFMQPLFDMQNAQQKRMHEWEI